VPPPLVSTDGRRAVAAATERHHNATWLALASIGPGWPDGHLGAEVPAVRVHSAHGHPGPTLAAGLTLLGACSRSRPERPTTQDRWAEMATTATVPIPCGTALPDRPAETQADPADATTASAP